MGLIIKKSISLLAIFLITPLVTIAISWHWQPQSLNDTSQYWFWITETATFPWAVLVSGFLSLLFFFLIRTKTKRNFVLLLLILMVAILAGQIVKSTAKSYFAKPRPYVLWIKQAFNVDDTLFYSASKTEKQAILKEHISSNPSIPSWLYKHWKHDTGYSFPSGHVLFANSWAFLALLLLSFKRHYVTVSVIIGWAIFVDISRLKLAMHFPTDLIASTLLAWLIALISYRLATKCHLLK